MRRTLTLIGGATLMAMALLASASAAAAATTSATTDSTTVSFALVTPNTAVAPSGGLMAAPGDWIQVTGGGTFTPTTATVRAAGTFVHHNADGSVHCRGTWTATALTGWTDFGATGNGRHGGIVSMLVTHHCSTMGEVHTDIPMTVTSTRNAPPGSDYVEGVTVGEFTRPTAGTVVIRASGGQH
jgi:hypothetical protein